MIRVLILCLTSASALAVSNPEIATKSSKAASPSSQQAAQKSIPPNDEPLLNSINVYAQQYESAASPKQYNGGQLYSQPYTSVTNYNSPQLPSSPTIESNFQPMPSPHQQQQQPHIQPHQNIPTPVIMQYMPQPQMNDGVQYLQLIPTRPLIVPISPYMSPMSPHTYQGPQIVSTPTRSEFTPAGRALLAAEPNPANSIPYGIQGYANSLQNYRSYRINREIKPENAPAEFSLNLNEYMPSPNDAPKSAVLIRGRP